MRTKILILGLICFFIFGSGCGKTVGYAEVVMIEGPTSYGSYSYYVRGTVKNIGLAPALNTRISIKLYPEPGRVVGMGETMINPRGNGRLEPQQQIGWSFTFSSNPGLVQQMGEGSEIRYEITWEE